MKIKLILTKISDSAQFTPQQKGILFEKLVKYYFQYDPLQRQSYSKVYTFKEFIQAKKLHNSDFKRDYQDRGIDLILVNPENTLCAVQCKFHQKTLRIKDVASFYATVRALNTNPRYKQQIQITETILFTKANHLSSNITKDYLNKNDRLFWKQHLIASTIAKWPTIEDLQKDQFKTPTFKTPKKLRPYQKEAVAKVINGFQNQDRGQLIMACGTGKTFTALKIAEAMAQKKSKTNFTLLFAMPSLSLVNQTMSEWYSNSDKTLNWKAMVVCSDKTIGKDYDTWQNEPEYLLIKPTTDPLTIAKQWKQIHEQQQRLVIFSTYHSLKQIQLAQQQDPTNCVLDLIIADEAHNTAGVKAKKSIFAIIHDDKNINSKKRLYMTATPKIYQGKEIAKSKSQNQEETAYDLIAMNDEKTFGKRFFEYDFKKAVEQNYLSNYKLIVGFWIKEKIDAKDKQKYDDINSKIDWDHFLTEMTIFKYALDHPETLEQNTTYSNPPPAPTYLPRW